MALMIRELYEALLSAGASEEQAGRAAEAVAVYDERFSRLENRMTALEGRMGVLEGRVQAVEGRVTMLTWVVGLHVALTLAGFGVVLNLLWQVLERLPRSP